MEGDESEVNYDSEELLNRDHIPPEDVFSALQSEVRLAVLRVLWDATDTPIPYSELKRRVQVTSSNFNYHVDQLLGHFVRRGEEGYQLRHAGTEVVRTIIAGGITDELSLGPLEIDSKCPYCESAIEVRYDDGLFSARCTGCAGIINDEDLPRGTIIRYAFPPAGVVGRTPEELLAAAQALYDAKITPMLNGVCPECAGTVVHSLDICEAHALAENEVCDACGGRFTVWTTHECERCGYARRFVPWFKLLLEPAVISFYYEQSDFDRSIPFNKLVWRNAPYIRSITQSIVSTNPVEICVEIPLGTARLQATMDENLDLVDIQQTELDE
jgi:hypothetical protein